MKIIKSICLGTFAALIFCLSLTARSQSSTSGDIAGTVTDPMGALVAGATVSAQNAGTGLTYAAKTNDGGTYHLSTLEPGTYVISVTGTQLTSPHVSITVSNGQVSTADLKLGMTTAETSISVNGAPPLIQADSGNIATTLTEEQLNTIPNPGQSLTNVTQTTPGTTMVARTTQTGVLGYASTLGLPANSNVYSVDGGKDNDPVTSGPLDGALNTIIGQGDIQEVTVTTVGNAEYGYMVGAQIDAVTKSGSNKFHGDAYYGWNGRVMNADSFFNKRAGVARSFDNVNQVQTSLGGPIYRNKTFFFGDYEYYSVVLPTSTAVYIPSPAFETSTLTTIPASEIPLYQQMFKLYNNAPGASKAIPLSSGGVVNPDVDTFQSAVNVPDHETYIGARVDHIFNNKDSAYLHVKIDRGLQTAYIDPISPVFNVSAFDPITSGQLSETHIFTSNALNQFTLSGVYYNATIPDQTAGLAAFPLTMSFGGSLPLSTIGGADASFPEGHKTFNFVIRDTYSYQWEKHSIKTGIMLDHSNISDSDIDSNVNPSVSSETLAQFTSGTVGTLTEAYPLKLSAPLSIFMFAPFVQDDWKITPSFTVSAGVRLEHFADPVCKSNCIAHFAGSFGSLSSSPSTPYNQLIAPNQRNSFPGYQAVQIAPRFGFAWSPLSTARKLVVRGAYGLFVDAFSAYVTEGLLSNVPEVPSFTTTSGLLAPGIAGSATYNTNASDAAFTAGFSSGGTYQSISAAVKAQGGTFSTPNFAAPTFTNYPNYNEFNLGIQQELTKNTILDVRYAGTYGHNELFRNAFTNAYNPLNSSGQPTVQFVGLPAVQPNPNFAVVSIYGQHGVSNYNGLLTSLVHRSHYITAQINYTYSHALDDVSNGGYFTDNGSAISRQFNPNSTRDNYGDADYDVRHNFTASYILTMPHFKGPSLLIGGWQLAGTFFLNSGYPFSVTDSSTFSALSHYRYSGSTLLAKQLVYKPFKCTRAAVDTQCLGSNSSNNTPGQPDYFATATGFGSQRRNQLYGPNFFDADLVLYKSFAVPRHDELKFKFGAQFYNFLNHPNFSVPSHDVNSSTFGTITATVGPPVGVLGSNIGGDSSPRMIEFTGKISF